MASCSGLPICLSGIQIFPQSQRPLSRRMGSRIRPQPPTPAHMPDVESVGSDCEANSSSTIVCDHSDAHEERSVTNASNWPRLSLAQQMADLDRRREAVRRIRLQNRSHLMDYRVSPQQNDLIVACLQNQARLEESLVAKAA